LINFFLFLQTKLFLFKPKTNAKKSSLGSPLKKWLLIKFKNVNQGLLFYDQVIIFFSSAYNINYWVAHFKGPYTLILKFTWSVLLGLKISSHWLDLFIVYDLNEAIINLIDYYLGVHKP
jgi:hypothetical protein